MIKRNLITALVFILVCLFVTGASSLTNNSCSAVEGYYWSVNFLPWDMMGGLLQNFLIFLVGAGLFFIVKRKAKNKFGAKYNKFKYWYFAILPLLILYSTILEIPNNISNRSVINSLCNKSSTDGMTVQSKGVDLKEYKYLQKQLFLLPDLPPTAQNITIKHYADPFLGDFILRINFICEGKEKIDLRDDHWSIENNHLSTGKKLIVYEDHNGKN